jgi:hypothetical protein
MDGSGSVPGVGNQRGSSQFGGNRWVMRRRCVISVGYGLTLDDSNQSDFRPLGSNSSREWASVARSSGNPDSSAAKRESDSPSNDLAGAPSLLLLDSPVAATDHPAGRRVPFGTEFPGYPIRLSTVRRPGPDATLKGLRGMAWTSLDVPVGARLASPQAAHSVRHRAGVLKVANVPPTLPLTW